MGNDRTDKALRSRVFVATFAAGAADAARRYGYGLELNDLCISSSLDGGKIAGTISNIERELGEVYGSRGGRAGGNALMHGPFTELTPSSIDPLALELMWTRCMDAVAVCRHFDIKRMVLHSGWIPLLYRRDWHIRKSVEFWQRLSDALPEGMKIYVENVFEDEPSLMKEINEEVCRDNIGICLDVGHANCMTRPGLSVTDWIRGLGPSIDHLHLHNNDGREDLHDDIYRGSLDMEAVLGAIRDFCRPEVTLTIESSRAEPSAGRLDEYISGSAGPGGAAELGGAAERVASRGGRRV